MLKHYLKAFITLFFVLTPMLSTPLQASESNGILKFSNFSVKEGLSQNSTYSIAQDQEGFIWIASQDGLNRFDGEHFVQYRKSNNDPYSIADNFIRKVFIDKNNTLWVGTENGLSKYNRENDSFENFYTSTENSNTLIDNIIWDIYQDNNGTILVSTEGGLHKYKEKENYFVRILFRGFESKIKTIKTIFQDENNNYWLGTFENGIYLSNKDFNTTFSLQAENPYQLTIKTSTLFDIKVINNSYWLGTDNGLFVINHDYSLKKQLKSPELLSNTVRSIEEINKDEIWLGTINGLNIISNDLTSISYHQKKNHHRSLSNERIMDLFQDKNQNIWLATYEGINFFNKNQLALTHYLFNYLGNDQQIESITETTNKKVWFSSTQSGLNLITKDKHVEKIKLPVPPPYYDLIADKDNLWFTSQEGILYKYTPNNNKLSTHKNWKNSDIKLSSKLIFIENSFWFINNNGLLTEYTPSTESFKYFRPQNNSELINITKSDDKIWAVTSENQLTSFNLYSKEFIIQKLQTHKSFIISSINQIKVFENWVWLGSTSQGLALINTLDGKVTVFNEKNNLTNNYINSILLNDRGYAWCSTNKGLSFIDPYKKRSQNFYADFNLDDNEFLEGAALKSSTGTYFFGGANGIHHFQEEKLLAISTSIAPPVLTNLLIANQKVAINHNIGNVDSIDEFTLDKSLEKSQEITLKHQDSPFSFDFISPNNKLPEQIKYRYRLLGLESNWINAGENNRRATYTNLSSGKYYFEVQAYNQYHPNSVQTTRLAVNILPPWWLSNTALLSYCTLFILIISYFIQQLRYKNQYNLQIKQSEERLKLSLWGSGDEMWDWNIAAGKIYRSNIWGILEFPQDGERNIGTEQTNIHLSDLDRVKTSLKDHFDEKSNHFEVTYRVKDKNEKWIWVLDRGKIVEWDQNNKASRMTGTLKDISVIKKAEEKLKLFAKCIESISDAIVIYDREFKTVDVNKAFEALTKQSKERVIGTTMYFNQYTKEFNHEVKKHLLTKGNWHGEVKSARGNGDTYLSELNIDIIHDEHGKVSHFVSVFSDITERKGNEAELRKLANTDTLTGLPNRSFFQNHQIKLVNNTIPHALLVFDLDNFKKVNDSMGHEVGDILLCKVADRLLSIGRQQDTVYRLGGDEFSMLIENTNDIHVITSIAKEILSTIALPHKLKSQEFVLYSSIGIVLYPEDGANSEELLKNADTAMYHGKGLGGNKYQFFNESMNKQAVKRLQIENLIRHGLKEDYFSVFYQPKIEISTGKISGMEALVRFQTPNKGIISPGVFIPASEETGQIVEIGEVVLRKACYATKKWIDSGLFNGRVAVNLSAVQFSQPNLVSLIAQILLQSGLPAKHLELEITEGTVMDSPQRAIETMLQIRAMGINLSLDDFGTGYSSLSYLKKFPLNTLKIDKAFIDDIEESEQGRNMVATIVTIAHNLGLDVVAEGVESENQLSFLSGLHCEQMQGFLYSKPLSQQHFSSYLLSHKITDDSTTFNNL